MKWKLRSTASFLCMLIVTFLNVINLNGQNRYDGVKDPESVNLYWKNYSGNVKEKLTKEILDALEMGLSNITLFEYSFILEELLQSYNKETFKQEWTHYMDSLKTIAGKDMIGAGLIPLQAQFFHATLSANQEYKSSYPEAYAFVKQNTPKMEGMGYHSEEYEQVLEKYAFSDIVGEGIMMDFLMLEDVRLLKIIEDNPFLKEKYIIWIENLSDPANEFEFSELRPRIMLSRKQLYLVRELKQSSHPLAKITWGPLNEVKISRIRKPPPDSFETILTGTWEGPYANKVIKIYLNPHSNFAAEDSLRGYNKFIFQSDIKQINMRGTFEDKRDYYEVKLEEYRVPFEEEPKWKQDAINESWGGPDKFYPSELSYGNFNLIIDKKSKLMKGTWSSSSGKLVREFEIPKISN